MWVKTRVFEKILQVLANDPYDTSGIDLSECHIDVIFIAAKIGGKQLNERPNGIKV